VFKRTFVLQEDTKFLFNTGEEAKAFYEEARKMFQDKNKFRLLGST